jgi:nitrite transporter
LTEIADVHRDGRPVREDSGCEVGIPAAIGFTISSMMAGAYVGLGIILIFCVGNAVDPSIRPIVMGASFGIALTLVIFAGSDLFTGHTMFMTHGWLQGRVSLRELTKCWTGSWVGNLIGCALLAALFVAGGGGTALLGIGGKDPLIVTPSPQPR